MPRGQVLNIPNQQAVLVTTLSREQKASIALLNPNDGVLYVHLNGPALNTPTMWDWKVPSQSYCQLPGPWESLGVYYLDQSGSGRSAEVNVYESDSQISLPSFIAIGRAVSLAGTAMDITEGSQPQNPPIGTCRLWADGNGNLWHTHSDGTTYEVWDTHLPLGGALNGTLPNPTMGLLAQGNTAFRTTGLGNLGGGVGPGAELIFNTNNNVATFQSYDRTGNHYFDAGIWGKNISLNAQEGGSITLLPASGGDVNPNLHTVSQIGSPGQNGVAGAWTIHNTSQLLLPPGNWFLWWTAVCYAYGPFPFSVETNLWSLNASANAVVGEYGGRQFNYANWGTYYSCSGFGMVPSNGSQYVGIATYFPNTGGNALNLAPGYGGANTKIQGFRYA